MFAAAVWWTWKWRNAFIFSNEITSVGKRIVWIHRLWRDMELAFMLCKPGPSYLPVLTEVFVIWDCHPLGWCKLNTDGAVKDSTGMASCGGLTRDYMGIWVSGFACNLGPCSVVEAELHGVADALELAWNSGCRKLQFEMDSVEALDLIKSSCIGSGKIQDLLQICRQFLARPWDVSLDHIFVSSYSFCPLTFTLYSSFSFTFTKTNIFVFYLHLLLLMFLPVYYQLHHSLPLVFSSFVF